MVRIIKMSVNIYRNNIFRTPNFAQFFGFYTGHMIWGLEEGGNVCPLLSIQTANEAWFEHFEGTVAYEHLASKAREKFNTIPLSVGDYVFVGVDGYFTENGKRDEALIIDAFECHSLEGGQAYKIVIPYRSADSAEGLAIYQIKLFWPKNPPDIDKPLFLDHACSGFFHHNEGFALWKKHGDHNLEPIIIADY